MPYSYISERAKLTPLAGSKQSAAKSSESSPVAIPCAAYQQMQGNWAVIDAVRGGTPEIRANGEAYLPLEPFEKPEAYKRRLKRATLTPWYTRLVRGLVGMVLRKPVTVLDVSDRVQEDLDNINLLGDDLNSFSREVFEAAIDYGYTGLFVDYTRVEGAQTLAEEMAIAPRPYWIHYTAPEIIGFRYSMAGNRRVFTQLRIRCNEIKPDGDFGEKEVEQIKVYDLADGGVVQWRLFEEVDSRWEAVDSGVLSLPVIPFTFVYTNTKKALVVQPPMLEVAYLNIKHLQLSADLDHALHISANPKFCLFGYDPENGDIVASVDEALIFENVEGRAEWVAPPPTSFDSLEKRIDKTEEQMAVLGLSTMVGQKNVGESAEAKKLDRTQGDSIMAVISQGLQDAFDLCLEFHAAYLSEEPGTCQVNRNYDVASLDPQAIAAFSNLHSKGQISLETLLGLLKRGEIFEDEFDIEEELKLIEAEFKTEAAPPVIPPEQLATMPPPEVPPIPPEPPAPEPA